MLEIGSRLPKIADLRFLQARNCSPCLVLIILKAERLGVGGGRAGRPASGRVAVEGSALKLVNVVVRVLSQTGWPYEALGILIRFLNLYRALVHRSGSWADRSQHQNVHFPDCNFVFSFAFWCKSLLATRSPYDDV